MCHEGTNEPSEVSHGERAVFLSAVESVESVHILLRQDKIEDLKRPTDLVIHGNFSEGSKRKVHLKVLHDPLLRDAFGDDHRIQLDEVSQKNLGRRFRMRFGDLLHDVVFKQAGHWLSAANRLDSLAAMSNSWSIRFVSAEWSHSPPTREPSAGSERCESADGDAVSGAQGPQRFLLEIGVHFHLQIGGVDSRRPHDALDLLAVEIGYTDGSSSTLVHLDFHGL